VRLTNTAVMQSFNAIRESWLPLDGYYLKRATQDPDFVEE
jgi:hypothetical protein